MALHHPDCMCETCHRAKFFTDKEIEDMVDAYFEAHPEELLDDAGSTALAAAQQGQEEGK